MDRTDVLQGGCGVETLEAPEYRPPAGCYYHAPSANFGLDAWRRPTGKFQEAWCKPTLTSRCRFNWTY